MASSIHLHFAGGGLCSLSLPSITKHFELGAGESQGLTACLGGEKNIVSLPSTPMYAHPQSLPHTHTDTTTHASLHTYTLFFFIDCPFNHGQSCLVDGKVYNRHAVDPVSKETSMVCCLMETPQHTTNRPPLTGSHLKILKASTGRWEKAQTHPSPENTDTLLSMISTFHWHNITPATRRGAGRVSARCMKPRSGC